MNVFLTGAISLSNKGTAAIVVSTISMMRKRFPYSNMSIELFYPEIQKSILDLESVYNAKVHAPLFQSPLKAIFYIISAILIVPLRKMGFTPRLKWLNAYQNANVIVDISAEAFVRFYNESYAATTFRFILHLYPVLLSLFLGKKTVLLAQSLGPFWIFKPLMMYVIKKSTLITVRDVASLTYLRKSGVDFSKIYLTADPAFLLDVAPDSRIRKILKVERVYWNGLKNTKKVGICAGRILKGKKHKKIMRLLANVADSLIEEYDAIVLFISHSSGKLMDKSDDASVGKEIKKNVENKESFYVIEGDYSPEELKGIIGKLDVLISLRMHPIISAISTGVPNVIIAFNPKAFGLMKMLELSDKAIHVDEIDYNSLFAAARRCIENDILLREILEIKAEHIINMAFRNVQLLEKII